MRLYQEITITDQTTGEDKLRFPFVTAVEIISSRLSFTDTCNLTLPQRTRRVNKKISDLINIGDKITVKLGYYPNLYTEFIGYIAKVNPDSPMNLICEDEAFIHKLSSIGPLVQKNTTYKALIGAIYSKEFNTIDVNIGDWSISKNATFIDVLDELRQKLGTLSYWQDEILYIDYEIEKEPGQTIIFDVQKNVPSGSDQLEIQKATDYKTISYGLSPQKNGTKIELYAYYADAAGNEIIVTENRPSGTLNKFEVPNISRASLEKLIIRRLPNLFYTGATGSITTFGAPTFKHGDLAAVYDRRLSDRNGIYQILEVTKTFTAIGGYRQTAKLGQKISDYEP